VLEGENGEMAEDHTARQVGRQAPGFVHQGLGGAAPTAFGLAPVAGRLGGQRAEALALRQRQRAERFLELPLPVSDLRQQVQAGVPDFRPRQVRELQEGVEQHSWTTALGPGEAGEDVGPARR
jgi:hypothetical protein